MNIDYTLLECEDKKQWFVPFLPYCRAKRVPSFLWPGSEYKRWQEPECQHLAFCQENQHHSQRGKGTMTTERDMDLFRHQRTRRQMEEEEAACILFCSV